MFQTSSVLLGGGLNIVKIRMKSVSSIRKITKAMKMVAASKLRHDERRMENGLPFARPAVNLFARLPLEKASVAPSETILALTSDKGLCGGVNSAVARSVRGKIVEIEAQGRQARYFGVGGKGTSALRRLFADRFIGTIEDVQKAGWNFLTASIIAERVLASEPQSLTLVHNHYKSAIAYDTRSLRLPTVSQVKALDKADWSKAMDVYNFEPGVFEQLQDLHEFYVAGSVFGAMLDNITAEQSARMAAMDNASKNAAEMLGKLTLQYNKARQAKITTELCEIISGATAL